MIIPETDLILLKVPINIDSANQLNFANKEAQYNYFNSLEKDVEAGFTYQRKDNVIRYNACMDDIIEFNYCMYRNNNYSDKWFYAYIESMEYANDEMTYIKIKTDVYQTWQFDINIMDSFVEREHVSDDTIGLHTIPENVETGEYLPMNSYSINYEADGLQEFYTCVGVTELVIGQLVYGGIRKYGGVPSGLTYVVVKDNDLASFFDKYAEAGKIDAINVVFMLPGLLVNGGSSFSWTVEDNIHYYEVQQATVTRLKRRLIARPTKLGITLDGYTPKNNKLLTGQFSFIMGDNLVGGTAQYLYEYFVDPTACEFVCDGVVTPGCSIRCYPVAYKATPVGIGYVDNTSYSEGIMCSKLPIGSWTNDIYTNWLTQNGVNIATTIGSSGLQLLGGVGLSATGAGFVAGASSITSGALGIANAVGQIYEHSLLPPQLEGNVNSGDITFARQHSVLKYYRMTIKEEYARIIDNYFSMFGYKVNVVKQPNITGRRNWNYVKTIDCNIEAYIPQNDLLEIKDLFNKGITIWHNPSTFLDYSQNNDILS